jgi:methylase of polypeptide subunit release factors
VHHDSDPRLLAALRDDLESAGFTVEGLEAAWGGVAAAALGRDDPVPALAELDRRPVTAARLLGRLFVLGGAIPVAAASVALPRLGLDGARSLGLVEVVGEDMRAAVDLRPWAIADEHGVASWWILSDLGELALGGELPPGHVLGAGSASSTLAGITVPADGGRVLDLGTGSGIQALHAARTAAEVVGTDVSARALRFAALNAALNGVSVDLRDGDLYAPVAGERFDRIVSNPPFVITPRGAAEVPAYTYRDGGHVGDGLVAAVVRGARDHLAPGGIAQLLGNWEVRHGDPAATREAVLAWAGPLDAWVVERDLLDPAEYAETWVRDGGAQPGTPRWRSLVRAWLDDFEDRGVTAIGTGYVLLRAPGPGTAPLRRFEHLDTPLGAGLARALAAGLAAHDWQAGRTDDALADARLTVAPDVTEHRHHWPGEADPTVLELRQGSGFARVRRVDTVLAAVVGASDGDLSVRDLVRAVARILQVDGGATLAAVLPAIRELLMEGFLRPPA